MFVNASLYEVKGFKEWILTSLDEAELSLSQILSQTHSLAKPFLNQLSHVFSKEIPHDLPPKRAIKHHIDLILGATLLTNRPIGCTLNKP